MSRSRQPVRGRALAALAAAVALGLGSRRYRPVLPFVIAEYAGDTLWATAVFFMLRLIRPGASAIALAAATLAIAYTVELSQLAHPRWLDVLRQQPGVALILVYDFVTSDLACYTAGVMLALAIDALIRPPRGPAAQAAS